MPAAFQPDIPQELIHSAQIAAYRDIKIEPIVFVIQAFGLEQKASLVTLCIAVSFENMILHGDLAQRFPAKITVPLGWHLVFLPLLCFFIGATGLPLQTAVSFYRYINLKSRVLFSFSLGGENGEFASCTFTKAELE
jgi:hypothetical protein